MVLDVVVLVVVVVVVVVVVLVVLVVLVVVEVVVVVVVDDVRGRRRATTTNPHFTFDTCLQSSHPSRILDVWEFWPTPRTLRQADLQRRLRMMLQDQEQLAQGREIANVTMTNSIVTSYKQGGAPSVQTSSSRVSP